MKLFIKSILFLSLLFSCLGCEGIFETMESKLEGEWEYSQVIFREAGHLYSEDITSDYREESIEFLTDHSVVTTFAGQQNRYFGWWEIEIYSVYDYDRNVDVYYQALNFTIPLDGNTDELVVWDDFIVENNVITAVEYLSNGTYSYTLRKLTY